MKLDLVEINKLSPPGLWDLGALSALISTLRGVIEAQIGLGRSVHLYVRMIIWHSKELRAKTRENLNMRIKVWVMRCPERIERVRHIIGETAIRRWRKNRLAAYALSKYFGDWQSKFLHGFENNHPKQIRKKSHPQKLRPYNWKLFSLTKICNVERLLYRQALYRQGKDIPGGIQCSQPRSQRIFKPVEFTPYELVPEAATGIPKNQESKAGRRTRIPPTKTHHIPMCPPPEKPNSAACREPPSTNQ